jgi:hypothetical protein
MSESVGLALEDAGWKEDLLTRRLEVFRLRVQGQSADDIADMLGISRRAVYYDWAAIRGVLARSAGPELEETRAKAEARLERCYALLMVEAVNAVKGNRSPVAALAEIRRVIVSMAELRGAIDRRPVLHMPPGADDDLRDKSDDELLAELQQLAGDVSQGRS